MLTMVACRSYDTAFLDPAGLQKAVGIITNARSKGWSTPQLQRDPAVRDFLEWMRKYNPQASVRDANNVLSYEVAQTLVEVKASPFSLSFSLKGLF